MRPVVLWLGAAALFLGGVTLGWAHFDLPGRALVRGSLGDVAIMMLLVAIFAGLWPRLRPLFWFLLAGALGVLVEVGQALGLRGEGLVGELTIGSSFDPYDFLAYALGLLIAALALRFGAKGEPARGSKNA